MQSRHLLNLGLVIFLTALIALVVMEPGQEPAPQPVLLTSLSPDEIQRISVRGPREQIIELEKQGQQWFMHTPINARANPKRIESILAIATASSQTTYPIAELNLAQLHLATPEYELQLDDISLRFGTTDALTQLRYIQVGNSVHLITDRYSYLIQGKATDFIDTKLLPETRTISALKLPDLQLRFIDNHWQVSGLAIPASADAITKLLDAWRYARAVRISQMQQPPIGESITLEYTDAGSPVEFILSRNAHEIILIRPDLGLNFHFPLSSSHDLLTLSTSSTSIKE